MNLNINKLAEFIAIESVATNQAANQEILAWLCGILTKLNFHCQIKGEGQTHQPMIVAYFKGRNCNKKIVLYNHYDVAPINPKQQWRSKDPFILENIDGRLYGRGIADNKGPLFARLKALKQLIASDQPLPQILWLIQGEEEITGQKPIALSLMAPELRQFNAKVFLEETGFYDLDTEQPLAFLWSPNQSAESLLEWQPLLQSILKSPRIEYRHLNKLNGINHCPLLANLPKQAVYIGFGPNDKYHQIHRQNESLDASRLQSYVNQFFEFIARYAKL